MKTNFTKLGSALDRNLYQVYISLYHEGKTNYIPTKVLMMQSEIAMLKQHKAGGDVSESLYEKKRIIDAKIKDYYDRNQVHITVDELKKNL